MLLHGIEALTIRNSGTALARVYDTATGTLLASGTIAMPLSDELEWRLAPLPDFPLFPGREYTVAVFYSGGSTSAPYYSGTGTTYTRPGVLSDVTFCGSGASSDTMPTNCNFNQRAERLIVSVPEPGLAPAIGLGALRLSFTRRRRR